MHKFDSKVVSAKIVEAKSETAPVVSNVVQMHEAVERPDTLPGHTIKIRSPMMDAAIYMTVNHIVLNEGTPHEVTRPFEIFLATKDVKSQQWITAVTLLMSAVFRKGGDYQFMIQELKAVHDPAGGGFLPGGVYVPSVIAHIGLALEQHLYAIGAMKKAELSNEVKAVIEAKHAEASANGALEHATDCPKCHVKALVIMDGCQTCLDCGYSKCG